MNTLNLNPNLVRSLQVRFHSWLLIGVSFMLFSRCLHAFPPAPHHLIYGTVRNELGDPLPSDSGQIIFEAASATTIITPVISDFEPGVNYKIQIPMDAGITSDLYKPTALKPAVPFRIRVRIGAVTYLPIEMSGDFSTLGQPAKRTRLNLTLGEDLDGDGIPDAWERALIAALGGNKTLNDINSTDDADKDGLSNLDEYLAGTYAFDKQDGFGLKILGTENSNSLLEFTAIRGRTYTVYGSVDFQHWELVPFRIVGGNSDILPFYYSPDVRPIKIEAISATGQKMLFYKLMLQ